MFIFSEAYTAYGGEEINICNEVVGGCVGLLDIFEK